MPTVAIPAASQAAMDDSSRHRWEQMLDGLAGLRRYDDAPHHFFALVKRR